MLPKNFRICLGFGWVARAVAAPSLQLFLTFLTFLTLIVESKIIFLKT